MDFPPGALPLEIRNLSIRYGEHEAVRGLSLRVAPGEIYGLLGSNGAGKSSTIKSVVGFLPPQEGGVRVFGRDPVLDGVETKRLLGYVPEAPLLFDALTPWEFLEFVASVRGLDSETASRRAVRFVAAFQIPSEIHRPIALLSMGTRQKVLFIAALLHRPRLLVLDEPLHSLDPRSIRIARDLLLHHVADGTGAVLLSTHTMEVAERLCHRVGILDRGALCGEGTIAELRGSSSATLEEAFLRLTREEEGVQAAVRSLQEE